MKDLNKKAETEKLKEEQNGSNIEVAEKAVIIEQPAIEKKIVVNAKRKRVPSNLAKSIPDKAVKITVISDAELNLKEKANTKEEKTTAKPMATKVVAFDLNEEKEKPDSVKVIKKNVKKAEDKVDKLKKKVKKAKKKEVKKSKLKGLKEKLEKALIKLKSSIKKLKKE